METVVIAGAGPAGLSAAYELSHSDQKYKIILIEKEKLVGGISKTLSYKGNRMDLGGHRFFTKSDGVKKIWLTLLKEQGVPVSEKLELRQKNGYQGEADPNTEEEVMLVRRRVSRIYYLGKFFYYPISLSWKTISNLGLMRTLRCGISYFCSVLYKKEVKSLEDFYINHFGRALYEMFFQDYTTKLWGVSPAELSPEWGNQRIKKLSLLKALYDAISRKWNKSYITSESSLIEEFYYPKYGPGQLWEKMALELKDRGVEIYTETSCERILSNGKKITGIVVKNEKNTGERIPCDYLISSMPINELVESMEEKCPQNIREIASGLPYRNFITVGVLVRELQLKNETGYKTYFNRIPDCWIYIQEKDIKMGRMQIFNNWSPFMVESPGDTVWIGLEYFCSEQDRLWKMKEKDMIEFAKGELLKMKIVSEKDILDAVIHKVPKAYPAYFGSYSEFSNVREYLNQFQNLICIGRNGQHRYNNMDHAMLTGFLAACVIRGQADLEEVWNVNTDEEYHEKRG